MLDVAYYPHLVESILDSAPHETLLAFRGSCKEYKQRADAHLFTRVCLLPRADHSAGWAQLSGTLCSCPSRASSPSPHASSRSPTPSATDLSVPLPLPLPLPTAYPPVLDEPVPGLSSSPSPSPPISRTATPPPPPQTIYSCLPFSPAFEGDTLALTRVLDLPRDDAPRGTALQPLLWRLEQRRPKLDIVRNVGSRVPRCILPSTHTFVDFAIPWSTYLFRLGPSLFPSGVERAVLHAGDLRCPEPVTAAHGADDGHPIGIGTVLGVLSRSEIPASIAEAVVVVGGCAANPEAIVEYAHLLFDLAESGLSYKLEIVGLDGVLQLPVVDEDGRDLATQLAHAVAPYISSITRAEVVNVVSRITFTPMAQWIARPGSTAQLESRFDL